jgi:methionyl-tRNA formyltransferase
MGATKTGLTIFWPDGGIDTGEILLQKEIDVGPDDTTGALYFNHLFPMGVEAILESVDLIKEGKAPKIPQDEALATYEPPCDDRVAGIDWSKPALEVHNFIRGCDPQPGAFAMFKNEKVCLYGARLLEESHDKAPGTILKIDDQGIQVALVGGKLVVSKVRAPEIGKVAAAEFAAEKGLNIGDRLDN